MTVGGTSRRLRRGTKTEDYLNSLASTSSYSNELNIYKDKGSSEEHVTLATTDSPFQVQEYLSLLIAQDPHNIQRLIELPSYGRAAASKKGKGPELELDTSAKSEDGGELNTLASDGDTGSEETGNIQLEKDLWLYEHLRRLAMDLSHPFVVTLQEHCSRATCPEMKAGEWLYLCAAHATANETECCAIDYITHTLDGATALLNSSRYFPSRISIPQTSLKHFTSIARRLYRIFAHAWYHHREDFEMCEAETSLYERFLALSHEYNLVSPDLLVIPSQKALAASNQNGDVGSHSSEEESEDSDEDEHEDEHEHAHEEDES